MGRIYDALRKPEQERQQGPIVKPEPKVVVDASEPVRQEPAEPPLGAPGVALEPVVDLRPFRVQVAARPSDANGQATHPGLDLVAVADPSSPAAEHFRAIRSRVAHAFEEHGYRSLLVTSPGRGEGKSITASNLALLLATEINRRVLLIDGDLRKPAVDRLFGVRKAPGLSDIALGRVSWSQAVGEAPWNGLALLPAGTPVDNAAELLNGPVARQFFRDVRSAYDFVVIDAPPVLPIADAVVLAGLVDAVLLVARAKQTPREALVDAADALAKARLLGVVLNALPNRLLGSRRYYSYQPSRDHGSRS